MAFWSNLAAEPGAHQCLVPTFAALSAINVRGEERCAWEGMRTSCSLAKASCAAAAAAAAVCCANDKQSTPHKHAHQYAANRSYIPYYSTTAGTLQNNRVLRSTTACLDLYLGLQARARLPQLLLTGEHLLSRQRWRSLHTLKLVPYSANDDIRD